MAGPAPRLPRRPSLRPSPSSSSAIWVRRKTGSASSRDRAPSSPRSGDVVQSKFKILSIGYESAEIGFTGFTQTQRIPLDPGRKIR